MADSADQQPDWQMAILVDLHEWGARTVPQLANVLGISEKTALKHLKALAVIGLVKCVGTIDTSGAGPNPTLWAAT